MNASVNIPIKNLILNYFIAPFDKHKAVSMLRMFPVMKM